MCHYHDCVRGTIAKPDYRLVDDKLYFDCTMKHMDDEDKNDGEIQDDDDITNDSDIQDGEEKKKKKRKTKAMVINHHIYF